MAGKVPEIKTWLYKDTGNRKYQQDFVYVSPGRKLAANKANRFLGVVCDGMGGMADGGRASETAITMMQNAFARIENEQRVNIPVFFRQGIIAIDKTIHSFPKEDGKGSGTTMVAAIIEDNRFYWASVGDSRIYFLRDGELRQLTRDHNYDLKLRQMLAEGSISQEEYAARGQKEALISFLGIGNVSLMDILPEPYQLMPDDTIMLCSDGITKTLSDDRIRMIILSQVGSIEDKARQLVDAATHNNMRSQDNTSVVILQYKETDIKKQV